MNLYTSLTLKYLKENKRRTIITIIGVILSTALICGIGNIFESLMDSQIRETAKRKGSYHVSFNYVEKENLKYIEQNADVKESGLSSLLGSAMIDKENGKLLTVKEYDENAFKGFLIELKEGRLPTNNSEIVLSEDSLVNFEKDIKIGDTIKLDIGDRTFPDGQIVNGASVEEDETIKNTKEYAFKVVGIAKKPGFEYGKSVTTGFTYLNINDKLPFDTVNIGCIMKDPKTVYNNSSKIAGSAKVKNIESNIETEPGIYYNNHLLNLIGGSKYKHISSSIISIITLVTSIVVICTISTIYNTFSISIVERKKQFGVLSSIGATKSQIIKMVVTEGVIVSLIGVPIGLLCGTVAIDVLFKVIKKFFENSFIADLNLQVIYSPKIIILSTIIVLFTIFIAVMIPAVKAAKISPLEAIRNTGDFKFKKVKDSKLVKAIFKTEGVLAYKNIKRNRKRYRSIILSMIVSIVIFISFSGFMKVMLKAQSIRSEEMNYNVYMSSISSSKNKKYTNIRDEISKLDGVNNFAEDSMNLPTYLSINMKDSDLNNKLKNNEKELFKDQFDEEKIGNDFVYNTKNNVINFPGEEFISSITLNEGNFNKDDAIKDNGVILINKISYSAPGKKGEATLTNYKVGDIIKVSVENSFGEKIGDYNLKIMGITDEKLLGHASYRQWGLDFITYDEVAKNIGVELEKDTLYIDVDNETSIQKIEELSEKYEWNFYDERKGAEELRQTYLVMQIFVYGFLIVISLVSTTNIINTISTNISLRKRELAIIKSIGVTPQGFNRMVYLESILYGTISLLYGGPIGVGVSILMNKIVGEVISFGTILPWEAVIVSIVAVYSITLLSAMIPMKKLNKENIIENIRQESI